MLRGLVSSAPFSGRQKYSAWAPNWNPVLPNTSSPARNRVTLPPTDSMVPANSAPRMCLLGFHSPFMNLTRNGSAFLSRQSAAQTVVAWMRTKTSLSFGTGVSTSATWTTSGGPYRSYTAALMLISVSEGKHTLTSLGKQEDEYRRGNVPRRTSEVRRQKWRYTYG